MKSAVWITLVPCITCFVCGLRGGWFAVGMTTRHEWVETRRGPVAKHYRESAPLCSPACSYAYLDAFGGAQVYDAKGTELHEWLARWRAEQGTQAA